MPYKVSRYFLLMMMPLCLLACNKQPQVFESTCNNGITFKQVDFTELMHHIKKYDGQYVQINGKYTEGPEQSALVNDSLFADHSCKQALWVEFSQECPLYLLGSRVGLFEYNNGAFTKINGKLVVIKGLINIRNTGHLHHYGGAIEKISYIKL